MTTAVVMVPSRVHAAVKISSSRASAIRSNRATCCKSRCSVGVPADSSHSAVREGDHHEVPQVRLVQPVDGLHRQAPVQREIDQFVSFPLRQQPVFQGPVQRGGGGDLGSVVTLGRRHQTGPLHQRFQKRRRLLPGEPGRRAVV
jgi:hypothetical protein